MKTVSGIKFDRIIKEGFHELLKPMGFKKKANNFYLIRFTINTGIFVPEFWVVFYDYRDKGFSG
jgi:hypothetical protein